MTKNNDGNDNNATSFWGCIKKYGIISGTTQYVQNIYNAFQAKEDVKIEICHTPNVNDTISTRYVKDQSESDRSYKNDCTQYHNTLCVQPDISSYNMHSLDILQNPYSEFPENSLYQDPILVGMSLGDSSHWL